MTILCEPDQESAAAVSSGLPTTVRAVATTADAISLLTSDSSEHILVIGRSLPIGEVIELSGQVTAARAEVGIVLVRDPGLPAEAQVAMGAGVSEVVVTGDVAALTHAVERVEARVSVPAHPGGSPADDQLAGLPAVGAQSRRGQIVTVFSPKGGSGKTTVATNLAVALAAIDDHRVCLVDLDLEFGDVAISLRLTPTRTLLDAVSANFVHDADDLVQRLVTEFRTNLDCILAPVSPGDAEKIGSTVVADLLERLRTHYDFVVVDTPSQFTEQVLTALDASEHHVLITNPEIPALKNLNLTLDMLDLLSYPRDRRSIVFNKADDSAGLSSADIEAVLRAPIAAHVPVSRDVPASINRGVPLGVANPGHPVSVAIRKFASHTIIGDVRGRPKRSGVRSLVFRRRSA